MAGPEVPTRRSQFYIDLVYGVVFILGFAYLALVEMDARVAAFEAGIVIGYFLRVWEKMTLYEQALAGMVSEEAERRVADEVEAQVAPQVEEQVGAEVEDRVAEEIDAEVEDRVDDRLEDDIEEQVASEVEDRIDEELEELEQRLEGEQRAGADGGEA